MNTTFRLATLVVVVSYAVASRAELIAWDSFATSSGGSDYDLGAIQFQDPSMGLGGFSGAWDGLYDTTGAFVAANGALTHDLTPGTSLQGRLTPFTADVGSANRRLSRAIDYTPVDGTYYMSVLLQKSAPSGSDLVAGLAPLEPVHWSFSDIQGTYIGIGGVGTTSGSISFLTTSTLNVLVPTEEVHVGETYFALMQFDYSTSGPDAVTVTIYDGSSTKIASDTYSSLNLDGEIGRFGVLTSDLAPTTFVDEWRFGTALRDVMVLMGLPGDYNDDGIVNAADYVVWRKYDGALLGYDTWRTHFGETAGSAAALPSVEPLPAAVPEPSSLLLGTLGLAGVGLVRRGRRI